MSSFKHKDEGFTGLEAAIVLIAFVVVAAVFSYVVLGAGFFTTQKAQQTVHTSVEQSSSTLEIVGNVYGTNSAATGAPGDTVKFINFSMALAPGGTPIDFSKVVLVYSNETQVVTLTNSTSLTPPTEPSTTAANTWSVNSVQNSPSSTASLLLQPNEQFGISCYVPGIPANDQFTIEVRPSIGAAFSITRTVPAAVNAVNILY
ncbi:flagellin [Methanoregula boonei 6A8]|jgi:flagellin FlaB|uniref:Flagellin n=1 Tax=Methanoregula boonei (strain DSM 21154 / JCM 14090 / 6A8) TaxID=456442 RepID=A7I805_METB6|nr:archaellin/type IV pilin N-terminal domain-containing protein [Methanoregula boonei]ABS55866.1 flagellin [Methanoregula boonei 6A8]